MRLQDALGTCSQEFVDTELNRLGSVLRNKDGKVDTKAVEAAIAVVDGARPTNEIEAMLVMQMAVTHALAMKQPAHSIASKQFLGRTLRP
jgi:hypothetical protein